MKNVLGIVIAILAPFAIAAQPKSSKTVKKPAATVKKPAAPATKAVSYQNGIQIKSKGFKVLEAALYFDNQSSVPQDNKIEVNQRVNMRLLIDKGWSEVDGRVYPGATEIIKSNAGEVILESDDLFQSYEEDGVDPVDARYITLKAIITSLGAEDKYVIVSFRLWDKKSKNELTGSYKLYFE